MNGISVVQSSPDKFRKFSKTPQNISLRSGHKWPVFFLYSNVNELHREHPPSCVYTTSYGDAVAQLYTRDPAAHKCATPPFVDNLLATKGPRRAAKWIFVDTCYRGQQYSNALVESIGIDGLYSSILHGGAEAFRRKAPENTTFHVKITIKSLYAAIE